MPCYAIHGFDKVAANSGDNMAHTNSGSIGIFDDIDMSELDLVDVEIVRTSGVMGIPETGASCCTIFSCGGCACSSCFQDDQYTGG